MKKSKRSLLLAGILAIAGNGLLAAQSNGWYEQWYRAKFGRSSPREEAREKHEGRLVISNGDTKPASNWYEDRNKAKLGRNSLAEETRQSAERARAASTPRTATGAKPANNWYADWYKAKYGRDLPEVAR